MEYTHSKRPYSYIEIVTAVYVRLSLEQLTSLPSANALDRRHPAIATERIFLIQCLSTDSETEGVGGERWEAHDGVDDTTTGGNLNK